MQAETNLAPALNRRFLFPLPGGRRKEKEAKQIRSDKWDRWKASREEIYEICEENREWGE